MIVFRPPLTRRLHSSCIKFTYPLLYMAYLNHSQFYEVLLCVLFGRKTYRYYSYIPYIIAYLLRRINKHQGRWVSNRITL